MIGNIPIDLSRLVPELAAVVIFGGFMYGLFSIFSRMLQEQAKAGLAHITKIEDDNRKERQANDAAFRQALKDVTDRLERQIKESNDKTDEQMELLRESVDKMNATLIRVVEKQKPVK